MNGLIALLAFALTVLGTAGRVAADEPNMLKNADFAKVDQNGVPQHWQVNFQGQGANEVNGQASRVQGPEGNPALRIECTEFRSQDGRAWVILKQDGTVKTRKGQKLYVSFWMKQENINGGLVNLSIMRLNPWGTVYQTCIAATPEWRKVELIIRPAAACENTRFEIYFTETGTLYLSDIFVAETTKLEIEVNPIRLKMVRERKPPTEKNLLWNGSFEAGMDGWGTEGFDHNVVKIDTAETHHGERSARIDFDEGSVPVGYPDYPKARKVVFATVQCASRGWTRFERDEQYTLSLSLKSDRKNLRAQIGVVFMTGAREQRSMTVTDQWQRYALTFAARDIFGFVGISTRTEDFSERLWIDAVQVEKGDRATSFTSRYPIEVALHSKRPGGIYYTGDEVIFDVATWFRNEIDRATMDLKVLDYQEKQVYQTRLDLVDGTVAENIRLPVKNNGHYKLVAEVKGEGFAYTRQTHFVIIYPYARTYGSKEARFGTNHPYYSDLLQRLAQDAGVYWVRDWTLKWDNVEHEKGKWDFSAPDIFFDRARRFDMHVLTILPDPSSSWSSSGPPETRGKRLGDAYEDLWHLPNDMEDYGRYVRKCIERYQDASGGWEVLNEPYEAKTRDWRVEDTYGTLLRIVKDEADRVGKDLRVMRCGLHYLEKREDANADAARRADVLSEHTYPRYNDTRRFLGRARETDDFLQKHRIATDIWYTEYGKYSNDDPNYRHAGFDHYHANGDERTAAAYNVKYLVILFSHGVSKVFFHQRTWPLGMNNKGNRIHFDMLFDYGPRPHKFFPAVNALAWFLHPGTKPGRPVNEQGPLFAYSFDRPHDKVLIVWTDKTVLELDQAIQRLMGAVSICNMMGKKLERLDRVGDEPVYLFGNAESVEALERTLAPARDPNES